MLLLRFAGRLARFLCILLIDLLLSIIEIIGALLWAWWMILRALRPDDDRDFTELD